MRKVQLKSSCIRNAFFDTYDKDFTFLVNGEEFKTSRFVSDLISPKISGIHSSDPTIDSFTLNTEYRGDFSKILNLVRFDQFDIPDDEYEFFIEVIQILGIDSIQIEELEEEMSAENVIDLIQKHEKFDIFFKDRLLKEIDFAASHFFCLIEQKKEQMKTLKINTLFNIINNENLRLMSEDDLIGLINEYYQNDNSFSICYEAVQFENVSNEKIREFIDVYNEEDMTRKCWLNICERLFINVERKETKSERYGITFQPNDNSQFCGIINHLCKQTNNTENVINITATSPCYEGEMYEPKTVINYDNKENFYISTNEENSFLCIDLKDHRIILTDYTIRSHSFGSKYANPRNWKIMGSIDQKTWEVLDNITDNSSLDGSYSVNTFHIDSKNIENKKFRFIQIQATGNNWQGDLRLCFNAIEFYGTLL